MNKVFSVVSLVVIVANFRLELPLDHLQSSLLVLVLLQVYLGAVQQLQGRVLRPPPRDVDELESVVLKSLKPSFSELCRNCKVFT